MASLIPPNAAALSIAILRKSNQRTPTDSALHPFVTHFFTRLPCAQPACGFRGISPSAIVYAVLAFIWRMSGQSREVRMYRFNSTFAAAFATILAVTTMTASMAAAQSPNGVKVLNPPDAIKTTGTWDVGTRAGDFVYVAGMRGIDPKTNTLVQGDEARIKQAFLN